MQLSIIIPVYNVEAFIEKCIRSLEDQDIPHNEFEIIIVNDGSTDNGRKVVLRLMREFDNIVFIEQENKGVSIARNNAIDIARGEYLLPVDPDDYILPKTLKRVLERVDMEGLDVLYLGFGILNEDGKPGWHADYKVQEKNSYSGVDGYFAARGKAIRNPDRSVGIFYRKALLEQHTIQYPQDVPYLEDGIFLAKVFSVALKVSFDHLAFYQRTTTRVGSATNSNLIYSENAINGFLHTIDNLNQFQKSQNLTNEGTLLLNHVKAKFLILPLSVCIACRNKKKYKNLIDRLQKMGYKKINLDGLRLGYKRLARVYNFNPFLFYYFFPFNQKINQLLQ